MAKLIKDARELLHNHTRYKCCLLDLYKREAKRKEESEEIMRKIKPLLELSDVREVWNGNWFKYWQFTSHMYNNYNSSNNK